MKKATSNKDVVQALRLKSKELQNDIDKYEKLIVTNKDIIESLNKSIIALGGNISDGNKIITGNTFKDRVVRILEDERPRTSRQLFNDFIKAFPDTSIKVFYDFSGRFANIAKPAGIKKHKIPENPLPTRFIYGLSDWFDQDKLKEEYLKRIAFE